MHTCFPFVRVSIWAFCAYPVHFKMALGLDDSAAKVSIAGMVPHAPQARAEEADVWTTLLLVRCVKCFSTHDSWHNCKALTCKHAFRKLNIVYGTERLQLPLQPNLCSVSCSAHTVQVCSHQMGLQHGFCMLMSVIMSPAIASRSHGVWQSAQQCSC